MRTEAIVARIGSPVRLVCSAKYPIKTCSFKVPGVSKEIMAPHFENKCGIIIEDFKESMFGTARCKIKAENGKILSGKINILRPLPKRQLLMSTKSNEEF